MSKLAQALRSLRDTPPEPLPDVQPAPARGIKPRRRDEQSLLRGILQRLSQLAQPSAPAAPLAIAETSPLSEPPSGVESASEFAPEVTSVPPVTEAPPAPLPIVASVESALPTPTPWEVSLALELAQPAIAASYRQLADRLMLDLPPAVPQSVLLAGVGCTASAGMAVRLAWMLVESRGPLLIVDAEPNRTALSLQLQAAGCAGLSELLCGEAVIERPTSTPGCSLLPHGKGVIQLERSVPQLAGALAQWRSRYPLVLIDAGDALGPAAETLTRLCDATYLLVGLGAATTEEARAATKRFRAAGGRVLGCIAIRGGEVK